MRKNKNNKKWVSLIAWLVIILIITLASSVVFDMIIPFSKNTRGIEWSTNAYYLSYAWIEEALYDKEDKWSDYATWKDLSVNKKYAYETISTWSNFPLTWKWTKERPNYNMISVNKPIYMNLSWAIDWSSVDFNFCALDPQDPYDEDSCSTLEDGEYINIMLNSQTWSYYSSSWALIDKDDIDGTVFSIENFEMDTYWKTFPTDFQDSYTNLWCHTTENCILKMSLIKYPTDNNGKIIPWIYYKITWFKDSSSNPINLPSQYINIKSKWVSYDYERVLEFKYLQSRVSEIFDFTIFQ